MKKPARKPLSAPRKDQPESNSQEQHGISSVVAYNEYLKRYDFDVDQQTDTAIMQGWAAVATIATVSGVIVIGNIFGLDFLALKTKSLEMRIITLITFASTLLHVFSWWTGPRRDLKDLHQWLRTYQNEFSAKNNERVLIWLQILLVTSLCVLAVVNPLFFGVFGTITYLMNFIGFRIIRKKVRLAVAESREISAKLAPPSIRPFLERAHKVIENYWGTKADTQTWLRRERHQIRHATLGIAFVAVILLAFFGQPQAAYLLGAATLLSAFLSIVWMRTTREHQLAEIQSAWSKAMLKEHNGVFLHS